MARNVSVTVLTTRIRDLSGIRAERQADSVLLDLINLEIAALRDYIIGENQDYYVTQQTAINVVSGTASYDLAADFYKLRGVDILNDANEWRALQECQWADRNRLQGSGSDKETVQYRVVDVKIWLIPTPAFSLASGLRVYYIPASPVLTGASSWDGISGWDSFVAFGVAAKLLAANEQDASQLLAMQGQELTRIRGVVAARNTADPPRVRDTRAELLRRVRPDLFLPKP
jgi:hypothetical protein